MKKVTVYDVAETAGVSVTTVSRVLNHPESVKAVTREKILKTMDELGYEYTLKKEALPKEAREGTPWGGAAAEQGLSGTFPGRQQPEPLRESRLILVIVPRFTNPFHSTVLEGIKAAAQNKGYDIIIYNYDHNDFLTTFDRLNLLIDLLPVCGIILLSPGIDAEKIRILDRKVPVVQCADIVNDENVPYVTVDDYAAAKNATGYLIRHGRRKISLLKASPYLDLVANRERGYRAAMEEAGIPLSPWNIVNVTDDYETAIAMTSSLLDSENQPDALFGTSDIVAVAAVNAVYRKGLRIPEDIAVVGFDDTYLAVMSNPPLTTVHQPIRRMGEIACKMVIDRLHNHGVSGEQIVLSADLVVRGSTPG